MKTDNASDLIQKLQDLVAFQTVEAAQTEQAECFDYIANELAASKINIRRGYSNELPWLVATTQNTKQPKIILQAHLDVVPGAPEMYDMIKVDDKLIGRGVYDMKFAAACYLQLVTDLRDGLGNYNFGIMFTSDEEIGGENGVGYLLDEGYGAEICILPDGGDNWTLESECNGVWLVEIIAAGKTAHGSRPWEGENAIMKLISCLNDIQRVFPMDDHDKSTLTVSRIKGGEAMNQVPAVAKVTLDMRFTDEAAYSSKRIEVETIIRSAGLELETIARVDNVRVNVEQPTVAEFMRIAESVRGKPIDCGRSYGSSDAHYFTAKGIPTILIRPDGGGAHSDHEWINKDSFQEFYRVLKSYVQETAKTS